MDEYFCPNCGAILNDQDGFDPSCGSWTCTCCGEHLMDDDVYEGDFYEGVAWYCDACGALLNRQSGFSDSYGSWICTECGHINGTTESDIYESEDDYEHKRNNSDNNSNSGDLSDVLVGLLGAAIEAATVTYSEKRRQVREEEAKRQAEAERARREKEKERKAKSALHKKRAKAFLFKGKRIEVRYDSEDLVGKNISFVVSALTEGGFTNIKVVSIKDIYKGLAYNVGQVEQITIADSSFFRESDLIPYDAEIVVTYHDKREITIPFSERSLRKMNYVIAGDKLRKLGFTEIYEKPINDLVIGWAKRDGTVEKITIGGIYPFKRDSIFSYDAEIIIEYHTFKKK